MFLTGLKTLLTSSPSEVLDGPISAGTAAGRAKILVTPSRTTETGGRMLSADMGRTIAERPKDWTTDLRTESERAELSCQMDDWLLICGLGASYWTQISFWTSPTVDDAYPAARLRQKSREVAVLTHRLSSFMLYDLILDAADEKTQGLGKGTGMRSVTGTETLHMWTEAFTIHHCTGSITSL